ncbi:hypothetical protein [Xylocopilactobacillus apicola]|uniref:hypothetical protein n=1 Tax=Xylocopilactobacillus apicola TaxID=2932184 RepID=UPI002954AED0|nr:hypothetical protein [Xylocopilactobacillus apicola]
MKTFKKFRYILVALAVALTILLASNMKQHVIASVFPSIETNGSDFRGGAFR